MFFREELEKNWGDHCHSCTYCLSISKTLVTAPYSGTKMEFCSEACNSKYNRLFCHVSRSGKRLQICWWSCYDGLCVFYDGSGESCFYHGEIQRIWKWHEKSTDSVTLARLPGVTPAATKGSWATVSHCWERSNTSASSNASCTTATKRPRRWTQVPVALFPGTVL